MFKTLRAKSRSANAGGFILLDLAITVMISGIIMAGAMMLIKFNSERTSYLKTNQNLAALSRAYSVYVQQRWRLPCPASPDVAAGVLFGEERTSCTAATDAHGIVPYRTLGIPEYYAKDGYGNFFTYIVSPVFTRQNVITDTASDEVHRRLAYMVTSDNIAVLPKAQFCGTVPGFDPAVDDIAVKQGGFDLFAGDERDDTSFIQQPYNSPAPDPNYNRELPVVSHAMALISHGHNRSGAYLANNTTNQQDTALGGGISEQANWTLDRAVQLEREIRRTEDANNYDDVVVIFTQDEIYAYAGGGSCEVP